MIDTVPLKGELTVSTRFLRHEGRDIRVSRRENQALRIESRGLRVNSRIEFCNSQVNVNLPLSGTAAWLKDKSSLLNVNNKLLYKAW